MSVDEMKTLMREWRRVSERYILLDKDQRKANNERKQEIVCQLNEVGLDITVSDFGETCITIQ